MPCLDELVVVQVKQNKNKNESSTLKPSSFRCLIALINTDSVIRVENDFLCVKRIFSIKLNFNLSLIAFVYFYIFFYCKKNMHCVMITKPCEENLPRVMFEFVPHYPHFKNRIYTLIILTL